VKVTAASIPDLLIFEPDVYSDDRGLFYESFHVEKFALAGVSAAFVQDNHSVSRKGVLRGLHYQIQQPQGKLVRVASGEVFDVAVDLRKSSATFGRWTSVRISDENHRVVWIPPGFAHGFLVLSDEAAFEYKTTDYYAPQYERTLAWNDASLAIPWPCQGTPILSRKDRDGRPLAEAEVFE